MTNKEMTCKEKISDSLEGRLKDIREMWDLWQNDSDARTEDDLNLNEYGLSFDYVEPFTFNDQREGHYTWLLSWGGPSDEFRFYVNRDGSIHWIEYWFMDWFDGEKITLSDRPFDLLEEIANEFFYLAERDV